MRKEKKTKEEKEEISHTCLLNRGREKKKEG